MNSNSTRAMVETAYNEWIAASHALWDARMALSPECTSSILSITAAWLSFARRGTWRHRS